MRASRWWRLAGATAVLVLLAAPALPGGGNRVLAHAQLVASSPYRLPSLSQPTRLRLISIFTVPAEAPVLSHGSRFGGNAESP